MFRALYPIVLASGSPRRQDFLRELGLAFTVVLSEVPEPLPYVGELPAEYVMRAAEAKAMSVTEQCQGTMLIAADTVVALGHHIMGKPSSEEVALSMLQQLAGKTHEVVTGCCVMLPSGVKHTFYASTRVSMWACSDDILRSYVATGEPCDKAGAYGIQGIGSFLVSSIEGSWSNVVGLPVAELVSFLVEQGCIEASYPAPSLIERG